VKVLDERDAVGSVAGSSDADADATELSVDAQGDGAGLVDRCRFAWPVLPGTTAPAVSFMTDWIMGNWADGSPVPQSLSMPTSAAGSTCRDLAGIAPTGPGRPGTSVGR